MLDKLLATQGGGKTESAESVTDWDIIARNYHEEVLSPFAPEMVRLGDDGKCRNLLLNYLWGLPRATTAKARLLDLGCGPGNLLPHVAGRVASCIGVDISREAVDRAREIGEGLDNFDFEVVRMNALDLPEQDKYDYIVSANSILSPNREEILSLFEKASRLLAPDGLFLSVLPSFDTCDYLLDLWRDFYRRRDYGEEDIAAHIRDFETSRLMDRERLLYADDGRHRQGYHTLVSIGEELPRAGLSLIQAPQKVYYPWALCRKFGYGHFPDAPEEIWDWFVVAKKAPPATAG